MPRAFIIHGYFSHPEEAWLPWLKSELEKRGFAVALPKMPDAKRPIISVWVDFVTRLIGEPDDGTVIIGHSMGCNALIGYLESLGGAGKSVAKTVLVAGGFPPGLSLEEARERAGDDEVLLPWLTVPVDAAKVKRAAGRCTAILSDNDPYLPFEQAKAGLQSALDPLIIVEHGKGHFNEDDKIEELPSALEAAIS